MLNSGVTLVQSMDTLSHQPDYPNFGEAILEVTRMVGSGHTLSNAMKHFPKLFSTVQIAMVATGERTGTLAPALERLANWGERDNQLYQKVKSALTYPVVVLVVAFVLTTVLFLTVLPGFVTMFEERDMELPFLTKVVVAATKLASNPGAWVAGVSALALVYFAAREAWSNEQGACRLFRALIALPVVGQLLVSATAARYTTVMSTLLESGLDLLVSLRLSAEASGNPLMRADSSRLTRCISEGEGLGSALESRFEIYPYQVVQMVHVGEESSDLAGMFGRVSHLLDEDVGLKVEALGAALEPLMLVGVSVLVGTIVLAIIMPLYGFLNQLGL